MANKSTEKHFIILAYIAAAIVVCIWSGWITISRMGVQTVLSAADITMLRFATAAFFTLPLAINYDWGKICWYKMLIISLGVGFPYTMFSFMGLQFVKAADAGVLINGLIPVISAILICCVSAKNTISYKKWLAILLILIANTVMMGASLTNQFSHLIGYFFLILAAFFYSCNIVGTKIWGVTSGDVIAFVPVVNAILFFPIWLFSTQNIQQATLEDIFIQAGYQGIIVSIIALFMITFAIKHIGPLVVALFMALVPILTAILGYSFLGEKLSYLEVFGIILCSFGLFIYAKSK